MGSSPSKSLSQSFSSGALGPLVQNALNCSPLPSWLAISPQKKWSGLLRPLKAAILGAPERRGVEHAAAVALAKVRVLGEQAEADEQMGLAAAHGLLEVKDGLRRGSRQARDALADEVLHALRDVRLLEERGAVAFGGDQLVELLDLVAELDRKRVAAGAGRHRGRFSSLFSTEVLAYRSASARAKGSWPCCQKILATRFRCRELATRAHTENSDLSRRDQIHASSEASRHATSRFEKTETECSWGTYDPGSSWSR